MIEARERSRLQLNGCATERSTTFHKKLTSLPVKTFRVFANIRDSNSKKHFEAKRIAGIYTRILSLSGWEKSPNTAFSH